jgi:hypothetical protein
LRFFDGAISSGVGGAQLGMMHIHVIRRQTQVDRIHLHGVSHHTALLTVPSYFDLKKPLPP